MVQTIDADKVKLDAGPHSPAPPDGALLWPVYEFRPLPKWEGGYGDLLRLSDGKMIPDDGEYGLAFSRGNVVLMVELPYQRNIIWKGCTTHWSAYVPEHPRGNAWHFMLRGGEDGWGGAWSRDSHPNERAGRKAMNITCGQHGCANGRHVAWQEADPHIAAGLVRCQDTKEIVRAPERLVCCYCGDLWQEKARPVRSEATITNASQASGMKNNDR